uniref:DUF11 domain-containing protein n=1 Tax=candidate division WWE3 bacterium TaxID=2053526 RepID=A0A7C4TL46_UNCKA
MHDFFVAAMIKHNKLSKLNMATGLIASVVFLTYIGSNNVAFAGCVSDGAYGQDCSYDKDFEVDKDVRFVGDKDWKDKVTNVKKGQRVEFRVTIKSESEIDVDSMKMIDLLPDELEWKSGDNLVQYWQDFSPDEEKEFVFEVIVRDSEYERGDFEKCVVNKAEAFYSDKEIGSATATVCYSDEEIKELPKTGPVDGGIVGALGILSMGLGLSVKAFLKKYLGREL